MAKKTAQESAHVSRMIKEGKPRTSKRKKGNAPSRTSKRGNGSKIRRN